MARFHASKPEELCISLGEHISYTDLSVEEVRSVVPQDLQAWVDGICERQVTLADGFGRQDPRAAPHEAHVRAAATRLAEVAGAEESRRHALKEFGSAKIDVPDTVDELLDRAAGNVGVRLARDAAASLNLIASLVALKRSSDASERESRAAVQATAAGAAAFLLTNSSAAREAVPDSRNQPRTHRWIMESLRAMVGLLMLTVVGVLVFLAGVLVFLHAKDSGSSQPFWSIVGLALLIVSLGLDATKDAWLPRVLEAWHWIQRSRFLVPLMSGLAIGAYVHAGWGYSEFTRERQAVRAGKAANRTQAADQRVIVRDGKELASTRTHDQVRIAAQTDQRRRWRTEGAPPTQAPSASVRVRERAAPGTSAPQSVAAAPAPQPAAPASPLQPAPANPVPETQPEPHIPDGASGADPESDAPDLPTESPVTDPLTGGATYQHFEPAASTSYFARIKSPAASTPAPSRGKGVS